MSNFPETLKGKANIVRVRKWEAGVLFGRKGYTLLAYNVNVVFIDV